MGNKKHKLGWIDINLSELVKADWNYKEEDLKQSEKLKNNIKKNGQVENIIVRELKGGSYEVVNGNHRLDVMNELKFKQCHAFNLGSITKETAIIKAIETNETKFASNGIRLSELIKEVSENVGLDVLEESMPYTADEMQNMINLLEFDWEEDLTNGEELDLTDQDPFNYEIKVNVSSDTFERWLDLKKKMSILLEYENESKVIEFAIIEALNTPIESLK